MRVACSCLLATPPADGAGVPPVVSVRCLPREPLGLAAALQDLPAHFLAVLQL